MILARREDSYDYKIGKQQNRMGKAEAKVGLPHHSCNAVTSFLVPIIIIGPFPL